MALRPCCWITSQNDTAPKHYVSLDLDAECWITSQNDTAPKHVQALGDELRVGLPVRTTLLQNKLATS